MMETEEAEFELYNDDLESYFVQNESSFKELKEVPQLKYSENTFILSRIQEKQTKQLVYNLQMNRRGFIEHEQLEEDLKVKGPTLQKVLQSYCLGEYILTQVITCANDKVKSTLTLNNDTVFHKGQLLNGYIQQQ